MPMLIHRPILFFLFFGRKAILSSVVMWQSILYPPIFTSIIDNFLRFLFDWDSHNIAYLQRIAAYGHLYSFTSVKAVVHWFQIMRNSAFQMYDDDSIISPLSSSSPGYRPVRFPTKNITTPIVLLWGDEDSLVDIETMRRQLPTHMTEVKLPGYEHLDLLWGNDVDKDVIPIVLETLEKFVGGASIIGEVASPQHKVTIVT
jgi:lysosomal acid lipase/cholesteryl ester hydrolase